LARPQAQQTLKVIHPARWSREILRYPAARLSRSGAA
jgi:hypothetical protein